MKRNYLILLLIPILILAIAFATRTALILQSKNERSRTVSELRDLLKVGMTLPEAEQALSSAGIEYGPCLDKDGNPMFGAEWVHCFWAIDFEGYHDVLHDIERSTGVRLGPKIVENQIIIRFDLKTETFREVH
ncbi:MAG: hypothetical protein ACF8MJ_11485 [Phycisphaerales bacterium JB050]